jgi:hypothetical protein
MPRPGQPPMMTTARQAAAPRPRAYRGLATSDSAPMTGEPIEVLPTRAIDHEADVAAGRGDPGAYLARIAARLADAVAECRIRRWRTR